MRSFDKNPEQFFDKMKKKPELERILSELDTMTEEEIDLLDQPLWIREVLLKKKEYARKYNSGITPEQIADQMMASTPEQEELIYDVREWQGSNWHMPCGISGGMKIEVATGDLLIVQEEQRQVKLYSSYSLMNEQTWQFFLANSRYINSGTRDDCIEHVNCVVSERNPNAPEIGSTDPNDRGLFKIYRH